MFGQHPRHRIEQAHPVAGGDAQQPALGLVVGPQVDAWGDGETLHPARHPAPAGRGQGAGLVDGAGQVGLDHADQFAVVLGQGGGDHLEGVERPAIAGGVHLGVEDAEAGLVEIAADAGKQIGLVGGVDQHLHTFTHGRDTRPHDGAAGILGLAVLDDARQLARMPGDVTRVVAHEITHVQRVPQLLVRLKGHGV